MNTVAGRILAAMALLSWSRNFGYSLDGLLTEDTIQIMQHIDKHCVDRLAGELDAFSAEQDLTKHYLNYDPDSRQPWEGLLIENNTPFGLVSVPAFIAQGAEDNLVRPDITTGFVNSLCRNGKSVHFLVIEKSDHGDIADKSAAQVVNWMDERFRGVPAAKGCSR